MDERGVIVTLRAEKVFEEELRTRVGGDFCGH